MIIDMGVSVNGGIPKWMVYKGKSHLEMDKNWGYPSFRKPPYVYYHKNGNSQYMLSMMSHFFIAILKNQRV